MLTGPTPPAPEPRGPSSWPEVVGCLGVLGLLLAATCFIVWVIFA